MGSKPAWCPESVWSETDLVGEKVYGRHSRGFIMWPLIESREPMRESIARAILAERERCANIARNWPDRIEGRGIAERIMDDAR